MNAQAGYNEHDLWPFPYKAAIFDFDGTIADSDEIWSEIDRKFLERRSIAWTPDLGSKLAALGFVAGAAYVIERYDLLDSVEEVCSEWNEMATDAYAHEVELRPGAQRYIELLKQVGVPVALATSNSHEVLGSLKPRIDVYKLFNHVVCTQDVGSSKHEPDVFVEAAQRMGVVPADCVVFEDIPEALHTAHRAGFVACAVCTGHITQDEARVRQEADLIIRDWEQLMRYAQANQ